MLKKVYLTDRVLDKRIRSKNRKWKQFIKLSSLLHARTIHLKEGLKWYLDVDFHANWNGLVDDVSVEQILQIGLV